MASDLIEHPVAKQTMERMNGAKRTNSSGNEFWLARQMAEILGYDDFRNFQAVMGRAEEAMRGNGVDPSHHIVETNTVVRVRGGVKERGVEYFLSRAACYLIAMNGEPSKPEVAGAQAYFAIQTRLAEMAQERAADHARVVKRDRVTKALKGLQDVAKDKGVERFDWFNGARLHGLYEMSKKEVLRHKGLRV